MGTVNSASRSSKSFLRTRRRGKKSPRRNHKKISSGITQQRLVLCCATMFAPKHIKPAICRIQFKIILYKLYLSLKRISASKPPMKLFPFAFDNFSKCISYNTIEANVLSVKLKVIKLSQVYSNMMSCFI